MIFIVIRHHQEEGLSDMPVTHDSMRLIEQVKTVCEHRIYLDEAKELYSLISSKWLHVSRLSITKVITNLSKLNVSKLYK